MIDHDLLLVDTENNTNPATHDLGQSLSLVSYYLTMVPLLMYTMIRTQQAGRCDSTLPPSTPDLEWSFSYPLTMLKPLMYMIKTQQVDIYDSVLPTFTLDLE